MPTVAQPLLSAQLAPAVQQLNLRHVVSPNSDDTTLVYWPIPFFATNGRFVGVAQSHPGTSRVQYDRYDLQNATLVEPLYPEWATTYGTQRGTILNADGRYQTVHIYYGPNVADCTDMLLDGMPAFYGCPRRAMLWDHDTGDLTQIGQNEDIVVGLSADATQVLVLRPSYSGGYSGHPYLITRQNGHSEPIVAGAVGDAQ